MPILPHKITGTHGTIGGTHADTRTIEAEEERAAIMEYDGGMSRDDAEWLNEFPPSHIRPGESHD